MSKNLEQKLNQEKSDFFSRIRRKILPYVLGATLGLTSVLGCDGDGRTWPNRPPVLDSVSNVTANERDLVQIPLSASDPDSETLTYRLENSPAGMSINPSNEIEWQTTYADAGDYTVKVIVEDGRGSQDFQDIDVTVDNVPCYRIAFSRRNITDDELDEIYTMNEDGSGLKNLTENPASDCHPTWSPDGSKIGFASDRDGNMEVYTMNIDGTNQTRLTNNPAYDFFPSWSPDGTKIAFTSSRDGNGEIYVMDVDGANQINLTNNLAGDDFPSWCPDGTKIAFTSYRDGNGEIYVMNANGLNQINLTNDHLYHDWQSTWSPDGSEIAFTSNKSGDNEIWVMDANSGLPTRRLTYNPYPDDFPSWCPDGMRIAFESLTFRTGYYDIYTMYSSYSDQINLTTNNTTYDNWYDNWSPSWSPNKE